MIWFPYQQMQTMKPPYRIVSGEGVYLITQDGKRLIDSTSSWWSTIHGYQHPAMLQAIKDQVDQLSHVMLGGLVHEPVERLTDKLIKWLPGDLDHCFYSDSGSVAVEVALKMAQQYFANQGVDRTKVLALKNAYHGDTFRAMAVGDDADYHQAFPDKTGVIHIETTISALEAAFQDHEDLACLIVEPLLQGAGGMLMYEIDFLIRARELCDRYGVILIFDEVATGFGRTGNRFVADLVLPDILVLGKALTGGMIGHAVTVANQKIYQGFLSPNPSKAFMHGPTFMGNPLACAAALQSIELFESENYLDKIKRIERLAKDRLAGVDHPHIKDIRIMGGCIAIEVKEAKHLEGFKEYAYERGVFSRPFGTCLYTMPPYIISEDQLHLIIDTMIDWFK